MKIIIECNPKIDNPEKKIFEYFKGVSRDALDEFKIEIEGTELKEEYKWKKE